MRSVLFPSLLQTIRAGLLLAGLVLLALVSAPLPAFGPTSAVAQSFAQRGPSTQSWQRLPADLIASILVRRSLYRADGSLLYLLPSGSAYRERDGYLIYLRWGVVGDRLCLQDQQRRCFGVARSSDGRLGLLSDQQELVDLLEGDPGHLVWRYGLSLRTALSQGQVALGQPRASRRSGGESAMPSQPLAQRSTTFRLRDTSAAGQPRFGRSGEAVAKDGTVGRFAIRPQGQPSILPGYAAAAAPPSAEAATQVLTQAPAATALPQAAPVDQPAPLLFSAQIDKDPGCYAQLQHCQSRCSRFGAAPYANPPGRCARNCLDTYICTR